MGSHWLLKKKRKRRRRKKKRRKGGEYASVYCVAALYGPRTWTQWNGANLGLCKARVSLSPSDRPTGLEGITVVYVRPLHKLLGLLTSPRGL